MTKPAQQYFLKGKEAKKLFEEFGQKYKIHIQNFLNMKMQVQLIKTNNLTFYAINKRPILVKYDKELFPTLLFDEALSHLPKVVVNMGAIQHICNGADIMAPGIVRVEGKFGKDDLVLVVDEKYEKTLAVGLALIDSETLASTTHGKILKNIHYVGDKIWNKMKLRH
jgi:PUA domain protein